MPLTDYLGQYFLNPMGLFALLALVPFILYYLIRPKPKDKVIPSLMFLIKKERRFSDKSFFRRFMRNLLFLIQLLLLTFIAVSAALPYITMNYDYSAENTVIVIDVSASTKTIEKSLGESRFEREMKIARDNLGKKNTIITAANMPELVVKDVSHRESLDALAKIKPIDTTTNIADAMIFAGNQVPSNEGRVVVISDFIETESGQDPAVIKEALESRGLRIDFFNVQQRAENIGIVDLVAGKDESVVFIKNYNNRVEEFSIDIGGVEKAVSLQPNSVESFRFETPAGITEIQLDVDDDLDVDNIAYISSPYKAKNRILILSNKPEDNLYHALTSYPKNQVETAEPPIVPRINHDIIITRNVDQDLLLKDTINEIEKEVKKGSSFIATVQRDLFDIDFRGMLPVGYVGKEGRTMVKTNQVTSFTKDIEFGMLHSHLKTSPKDNTIVIASSEDDSPLISYKSYGIGNIVYYGIDDEQAAFMLSPSYPLFWNKLVKFLIGSEDISRLNYRTGHIVEAGIFNSIGIHDFKGLKVAANLLSEKESNLNSRFGSDGLSGKAKEKSFKAERDVNLDMYLIMAAIALILIELIYVKRRGDF